MSRYYINASMLRKRHACIEHIRLFVRTFGEDRVLLNLANVKKAMAAGLDVTWPARSPWLYAPFDSRVEEALYPLYERAADAKTAKQKLAALMQAPAAWKRLDTADGAE